MNMTQIGWMFNMFGLVISGIGSYYYSLEAHVTLPTFYPENLIQWICTI